MIQTTNTKDHYATQKEEGNLAITQGDTFWSAARAILDLLALHGHAVFVTKRYIRAGAIVDFTADWIRLCEAIGLRLLHHHKAMLVEEHGAQGDLFGADTQHRTVKASFFRRLHMQKRPDLAILYEDVTCWVIP